MVSIVYVTWQSNIMLQAMRLCCYDRQFVLLYYEVEKVYSCIIQAVDLGGISLFMFHSYFCKGLSYPISYANVVRNSIFYNENSAWYKL